jgi:hypothetical protein
MKVLFSKFHRLVFTVYHSAVLLNSSSIFDKIFSDEFILDIIGALECMFSPLLLLVSPISFPYDEITYAMVLTEMLVGLLPHFSSYIEFYSIQMTQMFLKYKSIALF